ncbi:hypothetical protein Tco_0221473 [Tanacetum coccineum]
MVTVCSGYLLLTIILASVQLRTPSVFARDVSLTFFTPSILLDSCVENTVLIPWVVWNLTASWFVETTIPIFCIAVLPNNILYEELDLTMTKLRVLLLVRGALPIVISKRTSLMAQDFSLENPTNRNCKSTLDAWIEGFNFKKQCSLMTSHELPLSMCTLPTSLPKILAFMMTGGVYTLRY